MLREDCTKCSEDLVCQGQQLVVGGASVWFRADSSCQGYFCFVHWGHSMATVDALPIGKSAADDATVSCWAARCAHRLHGGLLPRDDLRKSA